MKENIITKFLNNNKVYVEIGLSICVIILTINTNKIAIQQKIISMKEKEPNFSVIVEHSPLGTNIKEIERSLLFYNLSGTYENFNENTVVEYLIEYPDSMKNSTKKRKFIMGFFSAEFSGELKQGRIRSLRGFHNESKIFKIDSLVSVVKKKLNLDYCFTEMHTYTKINYLNFIGEMVVKYYDTSFREGVLLNPKDGLEIFERYNESFKNGNHLDIDEISEEILVKWIKEKQNK